MAFSLTIAARCKAMSNSLRINTFKAILGESIVASIAATISLLILDVPIWATFLGWIAFFTRGITPRDGMINLACVISGLIIGIATAQLAVVMTPYLGELTLPLVVLAATFVILSMRSLPIINNVLAFFLGLVCYFASSLPPQVASFIELSAALALGVLAALLASLAAKHLGGNNSGSPSKARTVESSME